MVLTAERSDVLLLHARAAICHDCAGIRLMVPTGDPGGYCCTCCDAAVHVEDLEAVERRATGDLTGRRAS